MLIVAKSIEDRRRERALLSPTLSKLLEYKSAGTILSKVRVQTLPNEALKQEINLFDFVLVMFYVWLIHNKVISGFQAVRRATAPVVGFEFATEGSLQISGRSRYPLRHQCPKSPYSGLAICSNQPTNVKFGIRFLCIASPQQGDLRLSGPPTGQGAGGGARTHIRMIPTDLKASDLSTVPPMPTVFQEWLEIRQEVKEWGKEREVYNSEQ
ncbi:hypothetical protein PoB_004808800 [Plakobranchus ocellatus]|uniref:Uncharacterized protein n=1 Tax=Plakobranchus ocellatus TaxID=259542 RepID=A0AAV4BRX1_9GAST|nr:hypothetical protein PoB_004808800 [Plakobranchus ocellatus]